jgi:hypothetical protein
MNSQRKNMTHMDAGNAGFAGAKTCPCITGRAD